MWVIPVELDQNDSDQFTLKPYDKSFYYLTACTKPINEGNFKAEVHKVEQDKAGTLINKAS